MRREGPEVLRLEVDDYVDGELGLDGDGVGSAEVVGSVSNLFTHETVSVMSKEGPLREMLIVAKLSGPSQPRPYKSSNCCMHVSRFDSIEEGRISEEVPLDGADAVGLAGLGVELGKLVAGVGHEYASERFLHVLEITSRAKFRETRAKSSSTRASDVIAGPNSSVIINLRL